MTKIEKLEQEIANLSRTELAAFRQWFREYDAQEWDRQIEEDIESGKLDKIAEEAVADHTARRTQEL